MRLSFGFLLNFSLLTVVSSAALAAPLAEDFAMFENNPNATLTAARRQQIDTYSYLFVGGYSNELGQSHYFRLNIEAVHASGGTDAGVFFPSSLRAAKDNLALLHAKIREDYFRSQKPLIVIGHSKGGLETLATILAYPELVREGVVAIVVLIQAPVSGNTLLDRRGGLLRFAANELSVASGFNSLRTRDINRIIVEKIDQLSDADLAMLSRSVRYVISHKDPKDSGRAIRLAGRIFKHQVLNDGLVAKIDQWVRGFGVILGELYLDHFEVTLGKPVPIIAENIIASRVVAFTKSLLLNLMISLSPNSTQYRKLTAKIERNFAARYTCERLFQPR